MADGRDVRPCSGLWPLPAWIQAGRQFRLFYPPCLGFGQSAARGRAAMITVNSITVRLGGRTIIDRASAAIPPGSRVGLIGRNGAGKSTLMKVLLGQIDPDEGSIEMPRRTRLGYIAQEAPDGKMSPF